MEPLPPRVFGSWTPPASLLVKEEKPAGWKPTTPLELERAKATFDTFQLTLAMDGSAKATSRRRWLWEAGEMYDNSNNYFLTREQIVSRHVETFLGIHKKYADEGFRPEADDILMMSNAARNQGGFGLHFGAFTSTLASQCSPEQLMEWVPKAYMMQITGCLAQTEMGHGSNVRGLQTTATYDPRTEEFIIHSPTIEATKWWPGGMGKMSQFSVVYANLVTKGEPKGFHSFIVQLRDENHKPMPGIEVGEVGPKIGDNGTETGFLRFNHVRIPREWMLAKNQTVEADGTYRKNPKTENSKAQYTTMLTIRSGLVMSAGYRLAQGVTIAARYSCVRRQGFIDTTAAANDFSSPENQIIDYANQSYRVMKQLALAYAFLWTGKIVAARFRRVMEAMNENSDTSELAEMHAISSGLKALTTFEGAAGLEECRKCCGGHGVLLYSGVSQMALDYTTYVTAEGDRIILELQSARYLIRQLDNARSGKPLSGLCKYLAPCKDRAYDPAVELRCHVSTVDGFKDPALLLRLFRARALCIVVEVGDRFEGLQKAGTPFDVAWNTCAVDLVQASRAHCHYVMLDNFLEAVASFADAGVKRVMTDVARLYALQNISEDFGSFDLTRQQRALVRAAVRDEMKVIRPDISAPFCFVRRRNEN